MDFMCRLGMREHIHGSRQIARCGVPNPYKPADVILAISKLKNTKSTGHDQINLQPIKESLMVTFPYITLIYQYINSHTGISETWKHSIIIPIHKSGDIEEPKFQTN